MICSVVLRQSRLLVAENLYNIKIRIQLKLLLTQVFQATLLSILRAIIGGEGDFKTQQLALVRCFDTHIPSMNGDNPQQTVKQDHDKNRNGFRVAEALNWDRSLPSSEVSEKTGK